MKGFISYYKRKLRIFISKNFEPQILKFEKRRITKLLENKKEIVLIYSIGKVGSSSVYSSIKSSEVNIPTFHLHSLAPERIEEQKEYYRSGVRNSVPFHLIQSTAMLEALKSYNGKIYLLTPIREPISRELSSIFQDSFNFSNSKDDLKNDLSSTVNDKVKDLVSELPEYEWFERELKQVFNIDIFDVNFDFDPDQGYLYQTYDNLDFCLVRAENLNQSFRDITKKMFGEHNSISLSSANEASDKFYNTSYIEIKKEISLDEEQLEKVVNSSFIQKFYPDFISNIRRKWQREIHV
ncbi:putative capsular polysaccharide synthesis family protein [Algivirga pacifica]|uniref:Sulfotransferase domain-containing protein n=1 Tax=Algivirga pacifica TaxID=1162670 RepID=A0ABP9D963_9BACT